MAFTAYATLPELKAWVTLDDTVDDVVITAVLDSTSRWIDEHCDRHFWRDGATSNGSPGHSGFATTTSSIPPTLFRSSR
jgi:mannose/cellobiose epimerase-like protein (N-acyl-D-glucosamine 2-epimerase family)